MIIVTGGAGFIGSNIVKGLNARGYDDILIVDDLTDGTKYLNIVDCQIVDYMDKDEFLQKLRDDYRFADKIEAVFHEGACSTTTEWNGKFMMQTNYEYSKIFLHYCLQRSVPFLYASSAAVYGNHQVFKEEVAYEQPITIYGYSKLLFDQYVRRLSVDLQNWIVGFRYFNVYGPGEQHKGAMASVAFHLNKQLHHEGVVRLFEGSDGYQAGEQRRDFVYIDDVVNVNLWFFDKLKDNHFKNTSMIYNVGTGRSQTFNEVANAVVAWHGGSPGSIEYIPFPDKLRGHYQSFTEADITKLKYVGYERSFKTVQEGVKLYLDELNA